MKAATITILLMATCLFSEGADKKQRKQKDYPLAIEVVETQSVENAHDLARVKASDGNLYTISCPGSTGLLLGLIGDPHCWDVTLVPGTIYRARWNRGDLTVSVSADDKAGARPREATFTVNRSNKMTSEEMLNCKVCVLDAAAKENGPAVSQNAPQQAPPAARSAAVGDSVDDAVSDFHAWESKSECDKHMSYRQCLAQVEAAIPILQRLNLEWRALKREIKTESDDPRTPQNCRVTVSELTTVFDDYLLLQGKKVTLYESVDVDAPDAQIKWEMANAEYQGLQRTEESKLSDLDLLYKRLQQDCPADQKVDQREDSWDTLASASDAWKAGLNCGEHMNFRQCRAQVEAAKPALEQVHLEWQKLKHSTEQQAADPRTPAECRVVLNDAVARFDHYLLIQDKLVAMFESVDPDAPNAEAAWNAANAKYQQLQQEEAQLGDFSQLGKTLQAACP